MRIENIYVVQILIAEETLRENEFKLFFFEKSENLYWSSPRLPPHCFKFQLRHQDSRNNENHYI